MEHHDGPVETLEQLRARVKYIWQLTATWRIMNPLPVKTAQYFVNEAYKEFHAAELKRGMEFWL